MTKKVLCRFMINGKVLKLVERPELGGRWTDYLIMDGRKRAENTGIYNTYSIAWESFCNLCNEYFDYVMEGGAL